MAVSLLTAVCTSSKSLTRSSAAELIQSSNDFRLPITAHLPGKREWPTEARSLDEPEQEAQGRAVSEYARTSAEVAAFYQMGLINLSATLIEAPSPTHVWWRFELKPVLTEKGTQEGGVNSQNNRGLEIPIARRELTEVTGIITQKEGAAQVEFTWKLVPTPAGEAFDSSSQTYRDLPEWLQQMIVKAPGGFGKSAERRYDDIHKEKVLLQLYDDGWRVQFVQF